ncbi:MAG: type III-A CRISPR-associated RAMP protein Csm3 [Candidatus Helarchaeota archaeon]
MDNKNLGRNTTEDQAPNRKFFGKIIITGKIKLMTGLHIGSSREVTSIGGVDTPVVRNPLTMEPIIPGSSFKGKLRCLGELFEGKDLLIIKKGTPEIRRHECLTREDASNCKICRNFGMSKNENYQSRFIFRDIKLTPESKDILEKMESDLYLTELKHENSIDRITASADPRQFERVPAGAEFDFEIIYNIENTQDKDDDIEFLLKLFKILENDYLGGSGSRGYGKIKFEQIRKEEFPYNKFNPVPIETPTST